MSKSPGLRSTMLALIDEIHTLNELMAAQLVDDPEVRDSANQLARMVLHDAYAPHRCEADMFEDGPA